MAGLVLRLERGGKLLGEWGLGDLPLSIRLQDAATGDTVATFTAHGPPEREVSTTISGRTLREMKAEVTRNHHGSIHDEPTAELPSALGGPDRTTEGYDELPLAGAELRGALIRSPGDDFTLPLPEPTGQLRAPDIPSGRAEVWCRVGSNWEQKGLLEPGQRARMRDGWVRCLDHGALLVTPGPRLSGGADLPSGEHVHLASGQRPVRLPAGTSVTLWDGNRGLYVRSDMPDPVDTVPPVEYRQAASWGVAGRWGSA